jgi:predicted small secreted protein
MMLQKIATVLIVGAALATAACNTVRGAARDVNSVPNCTENAINRGHCKVRERRERPRRRPLRGFFLSAVAEAIPFIGQTVDKESS